MSPRFPSPLIKPDVRISRIRLSDWFHLAAHDGDTELVRAAEAAGDGKRAQQHQISVRLRRRVSLFKSVRMLRGVPGCRQSPIIGFVQSAPEVRALSSASITRPPRSYGPLRLPSDPPPLRRWGCQPRSRRVSPDYSHHPSNVPCPLPRRIGTGASVGCFPIPLGPSPLCRRVGIRDFTFEACSGFTRVTARWIAQPPKAAFVTRLQPARLPSQVARQLPGPTDNFLGGSFLHW